MPNRLRSPLNLQSKPPLRRNLPSTAPSIGPLWRRLWLKFKERWSWKKFWVGFGVLVGVLIIGIAGVFAYFVRDLPNPHQIQNKQLNQSTQILARDGTALYNIHGEENRQIVTGDKISPYLKEATVSVEDATFYKNYGFNFKGITRAILGHIPILNRLLPAGELAGGGSTITQQYVKNVQSWSQQETLSRKFKELILSVEVERSYSKDDILTGYLNVIPYGSSAYGIEAASQTYFGIDASRLTLSQAATLAAIPNKPTTYSPYGDHLDLLFGRKNYVLNRMVSTGYITQADADAAKTASPSLANPGFKEQNGLIAPHFVFWVRQQLVDYIGGDAQTAEQELDHAGFKVTTSLDIPTQTLAQQTVTNLAPGLIKKYNGSNACLTSVDPNNGQVLAMVGSVDYNTSISGNTNFCTSGLQPGSSFKPFVYATQFGPTHTFAPSSVTFDLVTNFDTSGSTYQPTDYNGSCEFCGPVTNRNALDNSLNIPAVKNLYMAGVKQSIQTAQSMGISTLKSDPSSYGLSLVLGSGSVEPVEMANAYASFANGGMHYKLTPILTIAKDGTIVKDYTKDAPTKALEPEVAYEMNSILSDNNARAKVFGTRSPLTLGPDRPVAAKTGTTQNFRDGWTVGYTPQIVTAVWVGNNLPNKTMTSGSDGVYSAAPLWNAFMKAYLSGKPVQQFTVPSDMKTLTVDQLSGKLPTSQTPSNSLITDIFAPWQVPTTGDDVHITVNIDSASGKLATSLTPAGNIVQKTFFNVHSEEPKLPNWEGPVQAWASANGGGTNPPNESDDVHTQANAPTISVSSPNDNATVNGNFSVIVSPGGARPITNVQFFLNNVSIGTVTQAPWSVSYSANNLGSGPQIIQAIVTNDLGLTASAQITVTKAVSTDTTPPEPATNVSGSALIGQHTIRLTWSNPNNSDLSKVNVYGSTQNDPAHNNNTSPVAVQAAPSTSGTYSFNTDGNAGATYYFIIRPVDSSGNEYVGPATEVAIKALP